MKSSTRSKKAMAVTSTACALAAMLCISPAAWGAEAIDPDVKARLAQAAGELPAAGQKTLIGSTELPEGAKISSAQAEQRVHKLFPVTSRAKLVQSSFREEKSLGEVVIWDLQFDYQLGTYGTGFHASVNAVTGDVISIHIPERLFSTSENQTALSRQQAEQQAKAWIQSHFPDVDTKQLTSHHPGYGMEALFSPVNYYFQYKGSYNGIPSDGDMLSLSVNAEGSITSFNRYNTAVKPKVTKPGITAEQAREQLEKQFGLELVYMPEKMQHYRSRTTPEYYLAWAPGDQSMSAIDAATGKPMDYTGKQMTDPAVQPTPVTSKKAPFKPAVKPLSKAADATTILNEHFDIPKDYKLQSSSLGESYHNGRQVWSLSYSPSSQFMGTHLSAEVDAATGQIYSMNEHRYHELGDSKPQTTSAKLTKAQAQQQAMDLVMEIVPNAAAEYKLTEIRAMESTFPGQAYYYVTFTRYAGEIKIWGESITVGIDAEGKVSNYHFRSNVELKELPVASKPNVTQDQARKAYLEQIQLMLKFIQYGGYTSPTGHEPLSLKLAYAPSYGQNELYTMKMIDAVTGKWRNGGYYYGNSESSEGFNAVDIEGHASHKALEKLLEFRVLVPDEQNKVYPDQQITTGEWFDMAARSLSPDYEGSSIGMYDPFPYGSLQPESKYYEAVYLMVSRDWLPREASPSFSVEGKLTRDELAVLLMKMLKYDKLAEAFGASDVDAGTADVSQIKHPGAALFAVKLNLLPLRDGKFLPNQVVTRAEAAEVLVKLADLRGKSDNFLNHMNY
ncbi:YcdB/YcdC domain-containing protein [Paenibacillus sp. JSM ZJ436]|uniref:YcdB/YcdC domain-containing protein n=1 Tax=Paenibacillus sp. JSM ZJ436 TaxID=3376190 RepID=UPI0037BD1F1D